MISTSPDPRKGFVVSSLPARALAFLGSGLMGGLVAAISPAVPAAVAQPPVDRCTADFMQAAAPVDTTIVSAKVVQGDAPRCKVEGYVTTVNPGPNRVGFGLQLPLAENWNRRFYFIAVGGSGGGAIPGDSSFIPRVSAGFATAGTDKGHPGVSDWSFNKDPAKALDNAHRAAHVSTVAAQKLTKAYYGVSAMRRYHAGCSGGGDMAIKAMQRYPTDYDGLLIGWPGAAHSNPVKSGAPRVFNSIFREMVREPGAWISPSKRQFVDAKVVEACDMTDGARDNLVWDHRSCRFDFKKLACNGATGDQCLTPPEVRSFENLASKTSLPISNIRTWGSLGDRPPPYDADKPGSSAGVFGTLNGWARVQLGQPTRDIQKQPLTDAELATIAWGQARDGDTVPGGELEIAKFAQAGGKVMFYVGAGDWGNEAKVDWFARLGRQEGPARLSRTARLYQVPGWGHCGGGVGPTDGDDRMLATLIDWVENGRAPLGITMHRGADREQRLLTSRPSASSAEIGAPTTTAAGESRDFLVCPYPMISVFERSKARIPGAVYEAKNWSCRNVRR